jgi:hypothetical protein
VPVQLELRGFEQGLGLAVFEGESFQLDEEQKALEFGGPVARERREVVALGIRRVGVLAGRGEEVDARDVLRQLIELDEQLPQSLGAGRADGSSAALREVACTLLQLVPIAPRLVGIRLEIAQVPTDSGGAEG